jgi:SPP1 family predicted phage head-tail adaptor
MPRGIGRLRFRIDLIKQADAPSANSDGTTTEDYQIIDTRWGDSRPMGAGHQFLTTRNIQDSNTHAFWIRFEPRFENRGLIDHIRFDGRMYEIQNVVTEFERDRFLKLECRILGDPSTEYTILPAP